MKFELLDQVRTQNPIAFNISNFVTVQDVANGINAIGGSPIMSEEINEANAMVQMSNSVTINLGAFTEAQLDQIKAVGLAAQDNFKPVVLDPVAVGAVAYRLERCNQLLDEFPVTVIRGNAGEVAALADVEWQSKGIDAGDGNADVVAMAKALANKRNCVVVLSGKTDVITDGSRVTQVYNQTDLFKLHVGSGDMLSSTIGVFLGTEADPYEAAQMASLTFAVAGQVVANKMEQPLAGSFGPRLIDELYLINKSTVEAVGDFKEG